MAEKIRFETEDGSVEFYLEEETRIGGVSYLLVSDSEGENANGYIMKEIPGADGAEACYEIVEDEEELLAVSKVFDKMFDDTEFTF